MRRPGFWIEIIVLATVVAFMVALLIATLGAAGAVVGTRPELGQSAQSSALSSPPTRQETFEGMVTCSRCGAKHSAAMGKSATECARQCVHGGATFDLIDGDKTYVLDGDLNSLKKFAGQRARIMGVVRGNTIKVSSVASET